MSWRQLEGVSYWSVFVATFLIVSVWESLRPARELSVPAERRWSRHAALFLVSTIAASLILRLTPVLAAMAAQKSPYGLLNKAWMPFALQFTAAVLILDFVKYATHRLHHAIPWLWRVHQVHHSDPDFDVSTAGRAHPIEVILTQGASLATVIILAPPAAAVVAAQLISCFFSFFEHANASLPAWLDRPLRAVLVTPNMHRIHHSERMEEQMSNYGEAFPWWDQLLGSYAAAPLAGEERMKVGLEGFQTPASLGIGFMLSEPFAAANSLPENSGLDLR